MMKHRILAVLMGTFLCATQAIAQPKTVTGRVTRDVGVPLSGVSVVVRGTSQTTQTNTSGDYSVRVEAGQVLQFRLIGYAPVERNVGAENIISVQLEKTASSLNAVVVTALGETTVKRSLGTSQQTVLGADIAQTGRENFINGLQGRVAGVEVMSTSGVPGASSSITIRGVSSISGSNQPLMIIDGMPMDNKTLNSNTLASDAPGSLTAFNNRGIDFSNRAIDINPEDIENLVVLKGPEAAALYGIDAANGAIVITTKRGKAGSGGLEYSNRFRLDQTRGRPEVQNVYSPSGTTGDLLNAFSYFGAPYAAGTQFYDNIDGFFQSALSQQHNLSFSGATQDNRINYRLALAASDAGFVVRNSDLRRINLTGRTGAQVTRWLNTDLSLQISQLENDQPIKGDGGPLIGLLLWPQTDDARAYLTPAGNRRRVTALATNTETDNPFFSVEKNRQNAKTGRQIANVGFTFTPFSSWTLKTNFQSDGYTDEKLILRHPESAGVANNNNGILDQLTDVTRNLTAQSSLNLNRRQITKNFSISGLLGNQISDFRQQLSGLQGRDFLDPNFVSANNTNVRTNRTNLVQRRLVSVYGQAVANYHDYLYLTVTGRNDFTSTIPVERNSFFYPGVTSSFVFSDAFPSIGKFMTGKLRAAFAEVGKDARPYAFRPALEFKTTSNGGYGYGFTGPNLALRPEFATAYEGGTELGFFNDRLGFDITVYQKETTDQIVNDIRGSYGTGFILFNLNGASTQNRGLEVTMRGTPVEKAGFSWDVLANFERARGKVLALPNALPESYVSDTWLYGNIRNGVTPGFSTRSLTGLFYLRNKEKQLLIDPTTGLPLRATSFIEAGYDRQPDFTIGLTNTIRFKQMSLSFLLDIRKGGDVFNATQHFLTTRGLSTRTLDRETPRVIEGVLRDGRENTATPTRNTIVVVPEVQTAFYSNMSEELFIEKNINWVRLRDVTFKVNVPGRLVKGRSASFFLTGTDLFLFSNYSGLDPVVNGNSAAVGGSSGVGIDYGNFPMPRGLAFGFNVGY